MQYRSNSEVLTTEKYLYLTKKEHYSKGNSYITLVSRVEKYNCNRKF
ncbi:MAG: hypothetical protein HRT71_12990 [Flavobacteriales bacterium]|nr:hypothetical protein [Flavobacteriales bacterium]